MGTQAAAPPGVAGGRRAGPPRFFSSPPGAARARRMTDAVVLVPALAALVVLAASYGSAEVDRTFAAFVASLPGWLGPIWRALTVVPGLWALVLLAAPAALRRARLAAEALAALALAGALATACARAATGQWPGAADLLERAPDTPGFPAFAVARAPP